MQESIGNSRTYLGLAGEGGGWRRREKEEEEEEEEEEGEGHAINTNNHSQRFGKNLSPRRVLPSRIWITNGLG